MNIKLTNLCLFFLFFILILGLNYFVKNSPDHIIYAKLYQELNGTNFFSLLETSYSVIHGRDPISYIFMWIFSNLGFNSSFYFAITGSIFALTLREFLRQHNAKILTIYFYNHEKFF